MEKSFRISRPEFEELVEMLKPTISSDPVSPNTLAVTLYNTSLLEGIALLQTHLDLLSMQYLESF